MNMMIIDLDNDGVIMFTKMSRSIFLFCFCYCAIHSNIEYTRVVVVVVDLWMWNSIQYNSFLLVDGSIDIIIGIICAWKKNNNFIIKHIDIDEGYQTIVIDIYVCSVYRLSTTLPPTHINKHYYWPWHCLSIDVCICILWLNNVVIPFT